MLKKNEKILLIGLILLVLSISLVRSNIFGEMEKIPVMSLSKNTSKVPRQPLRRSNATGEF